MTFDIESVTLTARAYAIGLYQVEVTLTAPDGAEEYRYRHFTATARADVLQWAATVGATVEFAPGFPK